MTWAVCYPSFPRRPWRGMFHTPDHDPVPDRSYWHPCTKGHVAQCTQRAPRSGWHKTGRYWQKVCMNGGMGKNPSEWVDELLRVGPSDWVPPVKRYVEPYTEPGIETDWRYEYERLKAHHTRETDILHAVIRELVRRGVR